MASSPSDLEHKAREAFIDDHFDLAVDLYTQAIALSPSNPELFADRAQANLKLRNLTESVADANRAIELDASLHKAYFRKGNACFELEEYQTAKSALEKGAALAPGDTRFANLIKKCEERIAEESGEVLNQSSEKLPTCAVSKDINQALSEVPKPETLVSNLKPKYRHEFYQKPEEVVVTVFAKGILASDVLVDFGEQILSVTIDSPGEDAYHFQPRLFGKVNPEKCRYEVLQTKIEIRLAKAGPVNWTSLECSNTAVPHKVNAVSDEENYGVLVKEDGSPSLSVQLEELSNNLKQLYYSTPSTLPLEGFEPKGPTTRQNLSPISSPLVASTTCYPDAKTSLVEGYLRFMNNASKEELKGLKGIGEKRASFILELREKSPEPFKQLDDLKILGLSSKQIKKMLPM